MTHNMVTRNNTENQGLFLTTHAAILTSVQFTRQHIIRVYINLISFHITVISDIEHQQDNQLKQK